MNPRLKNFLIICGGVLLVSLAIGAMALFLYLLELLSFYLLKVLAPFVDTLAKTSNEVLIALCIVCIVCCVIPLIFSTKIISSYQSFKRENADSNIFSEVYNDPTIRLKDKILFFSIYLIYYIQLPLLYCALKISALIRWLVGLNIHRIIPGITVVLTLINAILLIPVTLLELIKYPLIKFFSPLGLNVKQLSFLFNVNDVGTGSQSHCH
ncbi:hypothetical protein [Wolbachia endosymbiont of Armadillidium arcangelii]|uniref:Uncharacterized protein n=1 Tax=Wolbachia endosymbiont of Armadillidium arcangelii TaxID=3158571 RepID=A0AAU7Q1B4_9RICK